MEVKANNRSEMALLFVALTITGLTTCLAAGLKSIGGVRPCRKSSCFSPSLGLTPVVHKAASVGRVRVAARKKLPNDAVRTFCDLKQRVHRFRSQGVTAFLCNAFLAR